MLLQGGSAALRGFLIDQQPIKIIKEEHQHVPTEQSGILSPSFTPFWVPSTSPRHSPVVSAVTRGSTVDSLGPRAPEPPLCLGLGPDRAVWSVVFFGSSRARLQSRFAVQRFGRVCIVGETDQPQRVGYQKLRLLET